jgi:hypothetical protein
MEAALGPLSAAETFWMTRIRSGLTWFIACWVLACGMGILYLGAPPPVDGASPAPTELTLDVPASAKIGQDVTVVARLTSGGLPVTSRRISFVLDGTPLGASGVDSNGVADFRIRGSLLSKAGQASVRAVFEGSLSLLGSQAAQVLNLAPAEITIRTVPAIDGIPIRLGQQKAVTRGGAVTFAVPAIGSYDLVPDIQASSNVATRTDFVKWGDNIFTVNRTLVVEGDGVLELGLHVAHRGSFRFLDQNGDPVDSSRIERVILTSTGGTGQTFTTFDEIWLEAGSVVTRLEGLDVTERNWRVLNVQIAGTNVVNRGQQHLVPTPDAVWEIVVLLYDLKVAPVDALFGTNVHGTVDLKFPDGTVQTESIDAANPTLAFASLPRGNYELRLHTAGLGAPTPVALSRDQTASIRVITFVDLGILGSVMLAGVASLLWIGRRQQMFASAKWVRATAGVWSSAAARRVSSRAGELLTPATRGLGRARGEISSAAGLLYARTVEWLGTHIGGWRPSLRRIVPLRPAPPKLRPNDGEARTPIQIAGVDKEEGARTSSRRLAAEIAATVGAPLVAGGHAEQPSGSGTLGADANQPASPQPRFCRRCGNRMPDSKGVCPRCALRVSVRR